MTVVLLIAAGIAYVVVGLGISRTWYRRQWRPTFEEAAEAFWIVVLWPLFLIGWPLAKAITWLYTA